MCNFDFQDLAASLGKFFKRSSEKAGGGWEVPWSDALHRESVGRGAGGVCLPTCVSDPRKSSKRIVKERARVPT
jgi:hypothetical protein